MVLSNPKVESKSSACRLSKVDPERLHYFFNFVSDRFGIYLDSINGFILNVSQVEQTQRKSSELTGLSIEQLDERMLFRSDGPPPQNNEEMEQLVKHRMLQGVYKRNNSKGGLNHRIVLADCLCALFNEWITFKKDILKKKGAKDSDIVPVLGYLKEVRDRITHNDLKSSQQSIQPFQLIYTNHTLPGFAKDQSIELSEKDLEGVIVELRNSLLIFLNFNS